MTEIQTRIITQKEWKIFTWLYQRTTSQREHKRRPLWNSLRVSFWLQIVQLETDPPPPRPPQSCFPYKSWPTRLQKMKFLPQKWRIPEPLRRTETSISWSTKLKSNACSLFIKFLNADITQVLIEIFVKMATDIVYVRTCIAQIYIYMYMYVCIDECKRGYI